MISHTQGWLHRDIPGTDASGVVKSLMDMMHHEFTHEEMPNRVRITTPCCRSTAAAKATSPSPIHEAAEDQPRSRRQRLRTPGRGRPLSGRGDPPGDGRQAVARGRREQVVFAAAPAIRRARRCRSTARTTKIAVWVGGKHLNARLKPAFHKLVVANLPNNAPRWPEVEEVVRKILYAYKDNAKDFERMGEWIERIGWPRFFELTGLAFTKHHIDTGLAPATT